MVAPTAEPLSGLRFLAGGVGDPYKYEWDPFTRPPRFSAVTDPFVIACEPGPPEE